MCTMIALFSVSERALFAPFLVLNNNKITCHEIGDNFLLYLLLASLSVSPEKGSMRVYHTPRFGTF